VSREFSVARQFEDAAARQRQEFSGIVGVYERF
jgi:hypothetical protein